MKIIVINDTYFNLEKLTYSYPSVDKKYQFLNFSNNNETIKVNKKEWDKIYTYLIERGYLTEINLNKK